MLHAIIWASSSTLSTWYLMKHTVFFKMYLKDDNQATEMSVWAPWEYLQRPRKDFLPTYGAYFKFFFQELIELDLAIGFSWSGYESWFLRVWHIFPFLSSSFLCINNKRVFFGSSQERLTGRSLRQPFVLICEATFLDVNIMHSFTYWSLPGHRLLLVFASRDS